jgi:UDP-N-acetylmuramoyl-tripeptide--D-alanyl-D-alanine ligase
MIRLQWDEIVRLGLGDLVGEGEPIGGIKADSRLVGPGDLFVALNAGVDYVEHARARGAATLVPRDQNAALAALASLVRSKSSVRVVAIVGSTGKTSTKDILGALCAAIVPTVFADGSQNNEIGLPLTVCRTEPETEVLVTEMGMRGLGQIAALCAIARPHIAVVTSIGPEHLELLGTVANVACANAEAIDALPPDGVAIVPSDVPELEPYLDRTDADVRRFDRRAVRREGDRWRFAVAGQDVVLDLPLRSRHMAENALAALTAYDALGLPLDRAQEGAGQIVLSRWRGEMIELPGGGFVVNDAYNANPVSMRAALLDLTEHAAGRRRVAILGEMAELGDEADAFHSEIGALLAELGVEALVAVGDAARRYLEPGVAEMCWVPEPSGFGHIMRRGDAVLVKASRAAGLEGVPATIAKIAQAWSES